VSDGLLQELDCSKNTSDLTKGIWIDLLEPAKEQEEAVEALLHVDIPTREEVRSIDESSQIYQDGGVLGNDCKSYPARAKRRAPV
jgi:Mg2+ and Co2+ transporter CorA